MKPFILIDTPNFFSVRHCLIFTVLSPNFQQVENESHISIAQSCKKARKEKFEVNVQVCFHQNPLREPLWSIQHCRNRSSAYNRRQNALEEPSDTFKAVDFLDSRHQFDWFSLWELHSDFYSIQGMWDDVWYDSCAYSSYHVYLRIAHLFE